MYLFKLWTDFLPEDSKLFLKFFKNMRNPRTEIFASNTTHFHFFQFQKLIWSLKEFPDDYQAIHKSIVSFENKILLKFPIFGLGLSLFFLSFDSNSSNFLISACELINVLCMLSGELLIWRNFEFWSRNICYCLLSTEKKRVWLVKVFCWTNKRSIFSVEKKRKQIFLLKNSKFRQISKSQDAIPRT